MIQKTASHTNKMSPSLPAKCSGHNLGSLESEETNKTPLKLKLPDTDGEVLSAALVK